MFVSNLPQAAALQSPKGIASLATELLVQILEDPDLTHQDYWAFARTNKRHYHEALRFLWTNVLIDCSDAERNRLESFAQCAASNAGEMASMTKELTIQCDYDKGTNRISMKHLQMSSLRGAVESARNLQRFSLVGAITYRPRLPYRFACVFHMFRLSNHKLSFPESIRELTLVNVGIDFVQLKDILSLPCITKLEVSDVDSHLEDSLVESFGEEVPDFNLKELKLGHDIFPSLESGTLVRKIKDLQVLEAEVGPRYEDHNYEIDVYNYLEAARGTLIDLKLRYQQYGRITLFGGLDWAPFIKLEHLEIPESMLNIHSPFPNVLKSLKTLKIIDVTTCTAERPQFPQEVLEAVISGTLPALKTFHYEPPAYACSSYEIDPGRIVPGIQQPAVIIYVRDMTSIYREIAHKFAKLGVVFEWRFLLCPHVTFHVMRSITLNMREDSNGKRVVDRQAVEMRYKRQVLSSFQRTAEL